MLTDTGYFWNLPNDQDINMFCTYFHAKQHNTAGFLVKLPTYSLLLHSPIPKL